MRNAAALLVGLVLMSVSAGGRARPETGIEQEPGVLLSVRDAGSRLRVHDGALTASAFERSADGAALAAADLDRDGAPDLVAGYRNQSTGLIVVRRGNPAAYAPKDEGIFERLQNGFDPPAILDESVTYDVPEPADFVALGDFNRDGTMDVVAAASGGGAYLLPGDGAGGLAAPVAVAVPGGISALASGEFGAADGVVDLAIAVAGEEGPALLIYNAAESVASAKPMRFPLSAAAAAIAYGGLDNDPFLDIAVGTGRGVDIIHGWRGGDSANPGGRIERVDAGGGVRRIAIGHFIWNREGRAQIAAAGDDGSVRILQRGTLNTQPFSANESAERAKGRLRQRRSGSNLQSAPVWPAGLAARWTVARQVVPPGGAAHEVVSARILLNGTDDVVVTGGGGRLDVVNRTAIAVGFDLADAPAAVLPLPQKINGVRDLVVLRPHGASMGLLSVASPSATITVDRTDDPSGAGLTAASACTGAVNDCSLRGAVQFANANTGTTVSIPAGTYILSTAGSGGCILENTLTGNTIGDLEVNNSTTFIGAGSATTIIRQIGGAATGDRVFCLNVPIAASISYTFSGLTISGGRDTSVVGGGGIVAGAKDNMLTLSDVRIANNQATGAGNFGGGGLQVTGGSVVINTSTFGGSAAPGADRTDVTLANAESGSGGGIAYSPGDPNGVTPSAGTLTISGTTVSRNTAASMAAGGGGADLFTHNLGTGSVLINSTSAFSSNQATGSGSTGSGGGVIVESIDTTVAQTTFTSNSATNRGGGIYVGGGSLTLEASMGSVTFASNTATTAGSSISTASQVTVNGGGVAIGGDVEVTTNGTWTNSTGSSLSPTNFSIVGGTFNGNNSTMTLGGNLSIGPGAVVGGTLNASSATVNIAGNMTLSGGGSPATSFVAGTSTFVFNGSGAQSISGGFSPTFNHLQVNKSLGTLTLGVGTPVIGNLTVSSGTFDLATFLANRTAAGGGTLTVSSGATLKIGGSNALPANYNTVALGSTSTVEYAGTGSQTITAPITYGNLTSSNSGARTLPSGQTVTIAGTFTPGANTYTTTNSTVTFSSAGPQTIPAFNFHNLASTNGGARTLSSTGTIGVAGAFTPGASSYIVTGSTVQYNGAAAQTVPSGLSTYNNLTLNNASGVSNSNSITVLGLLRMQAGTFTTGSASFTGVQVDMGATFSLSAAASIDVNGNWTNNGTFTAGTSAVRLFGSSTQTLGGSNPSTFDDLELFNSSGATLTQDVTAGDTLTLTSGTFGVGTRTMTLNGPVSITSGAFNSAATGTVNYNKSTNVQNIAPGTYGNLTFSNFTKTLPSSGSVRILTLFTTGAAGGHTITSSTVDFAGSSPQALPANFGAYHHLTITNAAGVTVGGNPAVNGILTLSSGTLTVGAHTLTIMNPIAGTATNLVAGATSSIVLAGSAPGTNLPTSVTSLASLTLNNINGTSLLANLAIGTSVTLTSGILTTSANTLSLAAAATASRTTGYVNGNFSKAYTANGPFTYLVGTPNGYSPVTATVTSGTGSLTVKATAAAQPNLNAPTSLHRYWTLTGSGVTTNLVFSYNDPTDVFGTEANYRIAKVSGGTPSFFAVACPTTSCVDAAANTFTVGGVSSFSDWSLAEIADLTTSKSGPQGAIAGAAGGFDYTAVVTNNGPSGNTGLTVTDVLPAGATFSLAGSDPGCSAVGQTVTCTAASLANGVMKAFVIHVTVSGGVADGTIFANAVTAASAGTNDNNTGNNTSNTVNTKIFVPCYGCPFTDTPLVQTVTPVKAAHINQLRQRIDTQRIKYGLNPYVWTDPTIAPGSVIVKAQHILELRTALGEAYVAHGLPAPGAYTDPMLLGVTIKAVHETEIRSAVLTLEAS